MKCGYALIACLVAALAGSQVVRAAELPFCSNHVINEVVARTGCTVGDTGCWVSGGGFCTDYVEKMTRRGKNGQPPKLRPIPASQVRKGDVAQFNARAHMAYVERVVRDGNGQPVAVDLSEYNYGKCLVDDQALVTDTYKIRTTRSGVPVKSVDGGFLRPER
ncbi:MAG TPA: hypothetical protein VI298_09455 [Geobacteraceae bacterium]